LFWDWDRFRGRGRSRGEGGEHPAFAELWVAKDRAPAVLRGQA
jgi:hypothetical protein